MSCKDNDHYSSMSNTIFFPIYKKFHVKPNFLTASPKKSRKVIIFLSNHKGVGCDSNVRNIQQ